MSVNLTTAELYANGRKAYEEKRLSAQGPTPMCRYKDDSGYPCVIGASFTDEEAEAFDDYTRSGVEGLILDGLLIIEDKDQHTIDRVRRLQLLHDIWAQKVGTTQASKAEEEFRQALYQEGEANGKRSKRDFSAQSHQGEPADEVQDTGEAVDT